MSNNSTVRWVAIIITILIMFFGMAYDSIHVRLNKHDEILMEIRENYAEMRSDLRYIKKMVER